MKYVRYKEKDSVYDGVLEGETIIRLTGSPLDPETKQTGDQVELADVQLLAPLVPNEIVGIGANFIKDEADRPSELPETPIFFYKPKSSVVGPGESIVLPPGLD